jgi:hypothetical protein
MLAPPKIAGQGETRTSAFLNFCDNTRWGHKKKGWKKNTTAPMTETIVSSTRGV